MLTEQGTNYGTAHARLDYSLEVTVDDTSGEDGQPAPTFSLTLREFPAPLPWQLPGHDFGPEEEIEAWYGNDAPELTANRIRFSPARSQSKLVVLWEARYPAYWESHTRKGWAGFHFQGEVTIPDISMQVKNEEDASKFLRTVFGKQAEKLKIAWGEWTDYGPDFPATRRRWRNLKALRA